MGKASLLADLMQARNSRRFNSCLGCFVYAFVCMRFVVMFVWLVLLFVKKGCFQNRAAAREGTTRGVLVVGFSFAHIKSTTFR